MATATTEERKWIVLDGPVDPAWIENLNTVLDDSKKLCLMSGEIVHLSTWMRMLFEVRDTPLALYVTLFLTQLNNTFQKQKSLRILHFSLETLWKILNF